MKTRGLLHIFMGLALVSCLVACTLDNMDDVDRTPKTDYSNYNYVLATEDAATPDVTRFFSFNLDDINPEKTYDLIDKNKMFVNSDPSTSSGHHSFKNYIFSMAKDKRGYSSTPGLYRLTLNSSNRLFIDSELYIGKENLFPSRKLSIVDDHLGFYYNESAGGQVVQAFDPTTMKLGEQIDLHDHIQDFRPEARFEDDYGNNLIRTGSLVMTHKGDKLYVSVVFLEQANFNLISEGENNFYLAVIDIPSLSFDKIIQYSGAKTVGFFVSENNPVSKDESGNLYFDSWGWNQFNSHDPSKIFRIKAGETEFDQEWKIDIESLFGEGRIAQSMITFNNKLYLQVSEDPYYFDSSDETSTKTGLKMWYYEFDPASPATPHKLDIPYSNPASRINVFNVIGDKLFIAVPNSNEGTFNGLYSIDKNGTIKKEMQIANKYRPTRLYKLHD